MDNKFEAVRDYIREAVHSFKDDPADSDYQEGFLAAMEQVEHFIERIR